MKINMAEGDYFNVGMQVSCTTCHGQKIQGEVLAFDHATKLLALKSPSASGKLNMHDVRVLNLSLVGDVSVVKEATESPAPLSNINFHKLTSRLKQNLEEKQRQMNYIGVGVSPQAQKLVNFITKTISEVRWDGQNIIVMDQVTIQPPYGLENCRGKEGSQALSHVKKIVEKHYRELDGPGSS